MHDAAARIRASRDPEILRFTSIAENIELAEAEYWIVSRAEEMAEGESLFMVVELAATTAMVGSLGLIEFNWEEGRAEIGYWLLPEGRGTGHLARLVDQFSAWALDTLPIARLDLFTNTDNGGSIRLATRAGYEREGLLRSYKPGRTKREDLILFGRVADE